MLVRILNVPPGRSERIEIVEFCFIMDVPHMGTSRLSIFLTGVKVRTNVSAILDELSIHFHSHTGPRSTGTNEMSNVPLWLGPN